NWSRYYDRLFLGTVTGEIGPDFYFYTFTPDGTTHTINPGPNNPSLSRAASTVDVTQIDRNLHTPYTDALSIGFEREIAPEWSVGLTYISRQSWNLLQDVDYNHVICPQYGQFFGISPQIVCENEFDKFGTYGGSKGTIVGQTGAFGTNISGFTGP